MYIHLYIVHLQLTHHQRLFSVAGLTVTHTIVTQFVAD